jgi:hypothetical protein
MDKDRQPWPLLAHGAGTAQAGIRAEMYLGTAGMKAQMKYADKRGAPLVIIQGGDEKAKGEVQIKDLRPDQGSSRARNMPNSVSHSSPCRKADGRCGERRRWRNRDIPPVIPAKAGTPLLP